MGFFETLWFKAVVMQRNAVEYARVIWRYYPNSNFRRWDLALLGRYILQNPYRICHNYLKEIGEENPYLYGETPLTSLEIIARQCQIKKEDAVYELGSGRGRGCFWLKAFIGCKVVGIELVPAFIEKALAVKNQCHIDGIEFKVGNILEGDYKGATVIYLYGTCFEDEFIERLIERFRDLPKGTKFITVSYALTEYERSKLFDVVNVFPVTFTWGEADVYLQVRR